MKKIFISIFQVLLATLTLFVLLEIVFRFVGAPGGSTFVEKAVIEQGLTKKKASDEFRIFTYGESTMHGSSYGPTSSPARWLEVYIKDFLPNKNIRVVNFARIGHGSEFTYDTFEQTVFYKPDLAIFYLGHNDFLFGNRKDFIEPEKETFVYKIRQAIHHSYFLSAINRLAVKRKLAKKKRVLGDRIEHKKIETPPSGISADNAVRRDEPLYQENIAFFESNVDRIVQLAEKKDIPAIFLTPVCNLKDFAPFYSYHLKKLSAESLKDWESYYEAGKKAQAEGRSEAAFSDFEKAYAIDDTYADLAFRLGQLYFQKGNLEEAKRLFESARDNDGIIFRATSELLVTIENLKEEDGIYVLDTEKILSPEVPGGIMGEPVIEDNVHFSIKGHSLSGKKMAYYIAGKDLIVPEKDWQFDNERSFGEISDAIGVDDDLLFNSYLKMVSYFGSRYDNRIRFAKMALELKPNNIQALRHLAWSYWLKGDKEKAFEVYDQIKTLDPEAYQKIVKSHPEIAA